MAIKIKRDPFICSPITEFYDFIGRKNQLRILIENVYKAKKGEENKIIFVEGGSGAGKSSLVNQILSVAEGNSFLLNKIYPEMESENFYFLAGKSETFTISSSYEAAILSLYKNLEKGLNTAERLKFKGFKFTFKIKNSYVEFAVETTKKFGNIPIPVFDEFYEILVKLINVTAYYRDGIILIFDNMDKIVEGCNYGMFFKTLYENLNNDHHNNIMIVATGSSETYETLLKQESSLIRYIDKISLTCFSIAETTELLNNSLKKENIIIDYDVIEKIHNISYGYPSLVSYIGSKVYYVDKDKHIDVNDYEEGVSLVIEDKKWELKSVLSKAEPNIIKLIKALLMHADIKLPQKLLSKYINDSEQFTSCLCYLKELDIIISEKDYVMFKNPIIKESLKALMIEEELI